MIKILIASIFIILLFSCKSELNKNNSNLNEENDTIKIESIPDCAIPFAYRGYILIPCIVDSVKGNFILDTGADALHLDSIFFIANDFKYKTIKKIKLWGVGNNFQRGIEILDSVNFQFKNHNNITSNVLVSSLKPTGGDFIDGLIGLRNFKNKVLYVNYISEYLILYNSIDSIDVSSYNLIPLTKKNDKLFMPLKLKINDKITIQGNFWIDLGSNTSIISSTVAEKYNFDQTITRKVAYYTKYGGIGGYSSGFDFISDSVLISKLYLQNVPFSFSTDKSGAMGSDEYIGIIGNNILNRFDLLLDLKNNNLYLKSNANYSIPFEFDNSGFFIVDRNKTLGGFIVTGLHKNSPAEKQGLQTDDKIIFVNNVSVKKMSYKSFNNLLMKEDNIKLIVLRDEKVVHIKFKMIPLIK